MAVWAQVAQGPEHPAPPALLDQLVVQEEADLEAEQVALEWAVLDLRAPVDRAQAQAGPGSN